MLTSSTPLLRSVSICTAVIIALAPAAALAQEEKSPFTDVPASSPVAAAAIYMVSKGLVQPLPQFKPNDKFTRAQAAKILVVPLVSAEELSKVTTSSFGDVKPGSWYLPFAEAARIIGLVDSKPVFNPDKPVTKAEFIKMLLQSKKLDYNGSFSDIKDPLATDVTNSGEWTYNLMRYAMSSSMTAVSKEGTLSPGRELTRGDMALLYYRLDMYLEGRRTQALLSQAETEISNILQMLTDKQIPLAEAAAVRAVLSARGALVAQPNEAIVKSAVKVSEGFRALVRGFKAGSAGDFDGAIAAAKEGYGLADKAKTFSPALSSLTDQMQTIAKNMADEARAAKAAAVQ